MSPPPRDARIDLGRPGVPAGAPVTRLGVISTPAAGVPGAPSGAGGRPPRSRPPRMKIGSGPYPQSRGPRIDSADMPLITLDGLTKRYPRGVLALDGLSLDRRARRHRAGRRQRRRQVDAHQDPAGPAAGHERVGARVLGPRRGAATATASASSSATCRSTTACRPTSRATRLRQPHGPDVRPAPRGGPRADGGGPAPRGPATRSATGRSAATPRA